MRLEFTLANWKLKIHLSVTLDVRRLNEKVNSTF